MPSAPASSRGLAEGERLGLRDHGRDQEVVVAAERVDRLEEGDEVARHERRPLVEELEEGVLPVRPGLAPDDRRGLAADRRPSAVTCFPLVSIASCCTYAGKRSR